MKLLSKIRADKRVQEVSVEPGMGSFKASYFLYLKPGWAFDQEGEAHCFGEDTLTDLTRSLKRAVPCNCKECKNMKKDM